jgi:superfamily II DNA or RNA helicase
MIRNGDIVKSARWPEPVEVNLLEEGEDYIRLVGAMQPSRQHVDDLIPRDEYALLMPQKLELDCTAPPLHAFLSLEAMRYRFASLYDPLLAMNTSKIDALPHQIDAVYGHVLKPERIRFLIADDPGAGKTIMAGLIIKELKLRHVVNRILIVAPGHLKDQWRREMKERFEERFSVVDRSILDAFYGENVWQREAQIITSIDFIKRDDVLPSLAASAFDLIIVDEAHKMSAYRYGDKLNKTDRYKVGEQLSRITEHLLFLTATPHKGDPENFRLFLDLLLPGFFATNELLQESITRGDNPLLIRRVKEDLKSFTGEPLFLPRTVCTVPFNLGTDSPSEKELYNELSKYVNTQYNKALSGEKRRNVAFALVILQRRLASSTYALLKSLERRTGRLKELLEGPPPTTRVNERIFDTDTIEDLSEEELWKVEGIWETLNVAGNLSVAQNRQELEREIATLDDLARKARAIIDREQEIKIRELKKTLNRLNEDFPNHKVLIFTESRDTLDYLERRIHSWGYAVNTIHGGMKLDDRINAEKVFKTETQVLVATEAAGEGINLQFCHLMINYDLPWNPNRLEQRMGRIHRYGQTKEVFVFNLVATDTREGMVLNRLFEKMQEIKKALGSDKVFDVLSEVLYGKDLSKLLLEAAANARNIDDILKEIDITVDADYIVKVRENLGESLATHFINYPMIEEMRARSLEHRLIPEYTEAFFKKVYAAADGRIRDRKDEFVSIENVPPNIRRIAQEDGFVKRFGATLKAYPKATFDRDIAFKYPDSEFISFGHPLFEAALKWVERSMSTSLRQGAVFTDPDNKMEGTVLFYEGEIRDGRANVAGKRLFSLYVDETATHVRSVNPAFIWDLVEGQPNGYLITDIELRKRIAQQNLLPALEQYKAELLEERERQAKIKESYGIKSLDYLINNIDSDLDVLYDRLDREENVDLVIRNKREQRDQYELARRELLELLQRERVLTISNPVFIGAIKIVPARKKEMTMMKRDDEIERIGMEAAMEHERASGRLPEDVSAENLGFDVRSTDDHGNRRYIEVKTRAGFGPVELTQNEVFKARSLGESYFLYVVMNAASSAHSVSIYRNPIQELSMEEKIERRFLISLEELNQQQTKKTE